MAYADILLVLSSRCLVTSLVTQHDGLFAPGELHRGARGSPVSARRRSQFPADELWKRLLLPFGRLSAVLLRELDNSSLWRCHV